MSVFLYVYFSVRIYTYSVFARISTYTRTGIRTNVLHHVHIYTYASNSMYVYSSSTSKCTYAYVMNVLTCIQYMNVSVHIPKMEYVQINYACTYLTILYFYYVLIFGKWYISGDIVRIYTYCLYTYVHAKDTNTNVRYVTQSTYFSVFKICAYTVILQANLRTLYFACIFFLYVRLRTKYHWICTKIRKYTFKYRVPGPKTL